METDSIPFVELQINNIVLQLSFCEGIFGGSRFLQNIQYIKDTFILFCWKSGIIGLIFTPDDGPRQWFHVRRTVIGGFRSVDHVARGGDILNARRENYSS